jgi:hypothetical protein
VNPVPVPAGEKASGKVINLEKKAQGRGESRGPGGEKADFQAV